VEKKVTQIEIDAFLSDMRDVGIQISVEAKSFYLTKRLRERIEVLATQRLVTAIKECSSTVSDATKAMGYLAIAMNKAMSNPKRPKC